MAEPKFAEHSALRSGEADFQTGRTRVNSPLNKPTRLANNPAQAGLLPSRRYHAPMTMQPTLYPADILYTGNVLSSRAVIYQDKAH